MDSTSLKSEELQIITTMRFTHRHEYRDDSYLQSLARSSADEDVGQGELTADIGDGSENWCKTV